MAESIYQGGEETVSYSSFHAGVSTATFVVTPTIEQVMHRKEICHKRIQDLKGTCCVSGPEEDQSPYRAEIVSIFGAVSTLEQVFKEHKITERASMVA